MMWRPSLLLLCFALACGGAAATRGDDVTGAGEEERVELTDDPERARAFQAPLDIFVRPIDRALADLSAGAEPAEAFGDIEVSGPESLAPLSALDGARLEIGEVDLVIVTVKDRGPPDTERWQQATLEVTAVRAGGVFRLTAIHSELRQLASAPDPLPVPPTAWADLRDALIDSFGGPSCRFLPRLRDTDLVGVYDPEAAAQLSAAMPDQDRIDRTCGEWWDRTPEHRSLRVRGVRVHQVDRDRRVVARFDAQLGFDEGALSFGPLGSGES